MIQTSVLRWDSYLIVVLVVQKIKIDMLKLMNYKMINDI